MNIGIDAKRIFFNHSGLGNYGRRFYQALSQGNDSDSFYLYTPRKIADNNPYLNVVGESNSLVIEPEKSWQRIMSGSLWRSSLINEQLRKDEIEIYYGLSNEIPFGIKRTKARSVAIIHDLIFLRYPELYPSFDVFFYKKKTRYACKYADYIIAASEQTKSDIVDFYHTPADRITVIYPGTDPSFYSREAVDSKEFFNPSNDYIISIGAITPRKNLMKTIQAFVKVKDSTGLDLVVVGTAVGLGKKYLASIMDYIDQHSIRDRVHFLGNVPYKYLPSLCRNARLLVYPSQFEGFGMPIVEGQFSKIPVITSKGGCFPEAGGDGAVYVTPDDVEEIAGWIEKLSGAGTFRDELISKGLLHAERFKQSQIRDDIITFHSAVKAGN